jgi:hypothetical protein
VGCGTNMYDMCGGTAVYAATYASPPPPPRCAHAGAAGYRRVVHGAATFSLPHASI